MKLKTSINIWSSQSSFIVLGLMAMQKQLFLLIHYVDDQIHPYMFNQVLFDMNMYIML